MITNPYQKVSLDTNKRHFIVGDIHGRYETFLKLLEEIKYDPTTDIIYSVGDLIDRFPFSYETVKFFTQPGTYVIQGNHELMAYESNIKSLDDYYANVFRWSRDVWLNNGGVDTLESLEQNNVDLKWLKSIIEPMPIVLDVGESGQEHAFRLVHAELPPEWSEDEFLSRMSQVQDYGDYTVSTLMWSRTTIQRALDNVRRHQLLNTGINFNPSRSGRTVFLGHTPINRVITVGDMVFTDTWAGGTMSIVNAVTKDVTTTKIIETRASRNPYTRK